MQLALWSERLNIQWDLGVRIVIFFTWRRARWADGPAPLPCIGLTDSWSRKCRQIGCCIKDELRIYKRIDTGTDTSENLSSIQSTSTKGNNWRHWKLDLIQKLTWHFRAFGCRFCGTWCPWACQRYRLSSPSQRACECAEDVCVKEKNMK